MPNDNKPQVFEKLAATLLFGSAILLTAFIIVAVLFQDSIKFANPFKGEPAPPLEATGEYPIEEQGDPFKKPRPEINHGPTEAIQKEINDYSQGIQADPEKLSNYFLRAKLYMKLNKTPQALRDFKRIMNIEPSYIENQLELANALILSNRSTSARKLIMDVQRVQPENARVHLMLGKLYMYQGQFQKATEAYSTSKNFNPNDEELYTSKALMYFYQKQYEAALPELETAFKLNPQSEEAVFLKGLILYHLNKFPESLRLMNKSISLQPHFTPAFNVRGKLYMDHGQFENAVLDFKHFISNEHPNPNVLFDLSSCYVQLQQWEDGLNSLEALTSRSYGFARNNPLVFYQKGFCALMSGKPEKAKTDLKFFLKLAKESKHSEQISEAKKMLQKI